MDARKEAVIKNLRACLVSNKGEMRLAELNADYAELVGESIPFKSLGFSSLSEFISSSPGLLIISKNGEEFVKAEVSSASSHITKFISHQKRGKTKARKPRPLRPNLDNVQRPKPAPKVPMNFKLPKNLPNETRKPSNILGSPKTSPEPKKVNGAADQKRVSVAPESVPKRALRVPSNPLKVTSLPQNYETNPLVRKLLDYVLERKWPKPEFSAISVQENGIESIISRITVFIGTDSGSITNHQFTSYPNLFFSAVESLEFVADKAYSELLIKDSTTLPVTVNHQTIIHRIEQMLDVEKCVGFWSHEILLKYQKTYNESLPLNLRSLLEKNGRFDVSVGFDDHRYIIKLQSGENQIEMRKTLPSLVLPSESTWDVFVTKPIKINKILVRLIGPEYSDIFDSLATDMELEYMNKSLPCATTFTPGMYYVHVDSETCSRVHLIDVKGDKLEVNFIDYGDIELVDRSTIYDISLKYMCVPAQSFEVNLDELDEYTCNNEQMCYDVYSDIIGKSYVGVLKSREPLTLTLTDTSGNEEDINVNESIKKYIVDHYFIDNRDLKAGMTEKVTVISFSPLGEVFLNRVSETWEFLMEKIVEIDSGYHKKIYVNDLSNIILREHIYFIDSEYIKHQAQRVVATDIYPDNEIQVFSVDTGFFFKVKVYEIYFVEKLSDVMTILPFQAVKVRLHDVENCILETQKRFLMETISNREYATIRVTQVVDDVPYVNLYVSVDPNNNSNVLSVNEALMFREKKENNLLNRQMSQFSLNEKLVFEEEKFGLPKPTAVPSDGSHFQIYVVDLASPSNFTIMPVGHIIALNELMSRMKEFYSNSPKENIRWKIGDLCVAKDDNNYYPRGHIVSFPDTNSACVRLFDYGRMIVVAISLLRKLHSKFMSHPFTGLNAKLAGIKPKNMDWEVDDVTHAQGLLEQKKFFALVQKIETEKGKDYSTLSLKIIDTSKEEDTDISDLLVSKGKAYYVTSS